MFNGHNLSQPILSTGHADMVQTPSGDWWAVFLGTRPQNPTNSSGRPQLGRETFLAPISWTKDGWYTVNGGKDITFNLPGLYNLETPRIWKDSFKGKRAHYYVYRLSLHMCMYPDTNLKGGFADKNYYTVRTP